MLGDVAGGAMYLVAGMLAALLRAARTGEGTTVDAAIVDGSAHMMNLLVSGQSSGLLHPERGRSALDGPHWSRCYATRDGGWLSVQCLEAKFYAEFLQKLGLANDAEFSRQHDPARWPGLSERLEEIFRGQTLDHWTRLFDGSDACVAPVLSPGQSAAHPHMAARKVWATANGELQARPAPRFGAGPPPSPARPPARGEHTDEILGSLG
jgi:crotonobetainyl-CoA:carnitine CoA-transferase CaiB-like acyl-CoA transferase